MKPDVCVALNATKRIWAFEDWTASKPSFSGVFLKPFHWSAAPDVKF